MSSLSFGSNDDSTSICAADASLDIRYAFDIALCARYALPYGNASKSSFVVWRNRLSLPKATYRMRMK